MCYQVSDLVQAKHNLFFHLYHHRRLLGLILLLLVDWRVLYLRVNRKITNTDEFLVVVHGVFGTSENEQVTIICQAARIVVNATKLVVLEFDNAPFERAHVEHMRVSDELRIVVIADCHVL